MTSVLSAPTSPPYAFGFVFFLLSPFLYSSVSFFAFISLGLRPTFKCSEAPLSLWLLLCLLQVNKIANYSFLNCMEMRVPTG